ncbi:hypothetical protein [Photobacterium toruni]|uniref:Uncharacterized protein n=1 Tax=Photobacterium toruni TaxID=1935446 RepID=A0A1T4TLP6_9GAMM|nr:hypothetical protein [Photobacterium toruni]SKA41376.1 hypothetical protein CZ814_02271 [Photobacterium toruni]
MRLNQNTPEERLREEQLYKQISYEVQKGYKRDGLWLKAMSDCGNNNDKAKSLYVKLRFQSIIDEQIIERKKQIKDKIAKDSHLTIIDYIIIFSIALLILIIGVIVVMI